VQQQGQYLGFCLSLHPVALCGTSFPFLILVLLCHFLHFVFLPVISVSLGLYILLVLSCTMPMGFAFFQKVAMATACHCCCFLGLIDSTSQELVAFCLLPNGVYALFFLGCDNSATCLYIPRCETRIVTHSHFAAGWGYGQSSLRLVTSGGIADFGL